MKTTLTKSLLLLGSAVAAMAQTTLTGFGTGEFTVDSGSTSVAYSQTAGSLSFTANDQTSTFAGTFSTVNLTGQLAGIHLTATVTTNPASDFAVQLYDSSFQIFTFSGNWSAFDTNSPKTIYLAADAGQTGPFDASSVLGLGLAFGGTGDALVISLDSVTTSAVPEPATSGILLGLSAVGLILWHRQRR